MRPTQVADTAVWLCPAVSPAEGGQRVTAHVADPGGGQTPAAGARAGTIAGSTEPPHGGPAAVQGLLPAGDRRLNASDKTPLAIPRTAPDGLESGVLSVLSVSEPRDVSRNPLWEQRELAFAATEGRPREDLPIIQAASPALREDLRSLTSAGGAPSRPRRAGARTASDPSRARATGRVAALRHTQETRLAICKVDGRSQGSLPSRLP